MTQFVPWKLDLHQFTLGGFWTIANEYIQSGAMSELSLRFSAKTVYLVVSFPDENTEKKSFLTTTITDAEGEVI